MGRKPSGKGRGYATEIRDAKGQKVLGDFGNRLWKVSGIVLKKIYKKKKKKTFWFCAPFWQFAVFFFFFFFLSL